MALHRRLLQGLSGGIGLSGLMFVSVEGLRFSGFKGSVCSSVGVCPGLGRFSRKVDFFK